WTPDNELATETRYGGADGNTLISTSAYTYDDIAEVTDLVHRDSSGQAITDYADTYDLDRRLARETSGGQTPTYSEDADDQLTQAGSESFSYDVNGNRVGTGYQIGVGNQLLSDGTWTYTYDAEGNRVRKERAGGEAWTYGYNDVNQQVWAKHWS